MAAIISARIAIAISSGDGQIQNCAGNTNDLCQDNEFYVNPDWEVVVNEDNEYFVNPDWDVISDGSSNEFFENNDWQILSDEDVVVSGIDENVFDENGSQTPNSCLFVGSNLL